MVDHRVVASLSDILISLSLFSDIFGCISPLAAHIPECVSTILGCLNPRFLLLSFSRLEFIVPYPFGRAGGAILLFDKCTYLRLSMSICRLSPSLSFFAFSPLCSFSLFRLPRAFKDLMCSFISAIHLPLITHVLEDALSFLLSLFLSHFNSIVFSHLESPFLLGCAHRSMSLPIHRVVRMSHDRPWSHRAYAFSVHRVRARCLMSFSFTLHTCRTVAVE